MIAIGKSKAQERALDALLKSAHTIRVRVRLLDLNHNYLDDLTDAFMDGMVTVDDTADVSRALDLTLYDPLQKLHLDPDSPSRTSIYITDMISVVFVVMDPARSVTYEIPVFCGPISSVDRDDVYLDIKCLGKESLSITNLWIGKVYKKGQTKTYVIINGLKSLLGETKLSINERNPKLPNDEHLSTKTKPWVFFKRIARTMGCQLYYDGRGVVQMRKFPVNPSVRFDESNVTTMPKLSYDLSNTINAVRVVGAKPKKAKKRVRWTAVAPRSHPLSPWRIGRGGVPRYLWTDIQDDSLRTQKECKDLAENTLARGLLAGVEVTFDGLVNPRIQEGDVAQVVTPAVTATFPMHKFTIPLTADATASYGYLKRKRPKGGARAIKKKHRHHHNHHTKNKVGAERA